MEDVTQVEYPVVTLGEFLENISPSVERGHRGVTRTNEQDRLDDCPFRQGTGIPLMSLSPALEENLFPSGGMLASPDRH